MTSISCVSGAYTARLMFLTGELAINIAITTYSCFILRIDLQSWVQVTAKRLELLWADYPHIVTI